MPTRAEIVAKAREYVGTPFQHQGRIKGHACDCIGLLLMVGEELGMKDKNGDPVLHTDQMKYSSEPMGQLVHVGCQARMRQKTVADMKDGDVVTLRVPVPVHVAIISTINGVRGMIHAYSPLGKVVENGMNDKWFSRIEGVFELEGIIE